MMIIACMTIKSRLVPLIAGLCAQIYFRFEISLFWRSTSFAFLSWKKKFGKGKSS